MGVAFFFVISGFLLYRPFLAARFAGRPAPRIRDYARRRVLRIVPAYWLALTVLTATVGLCGAFSRDWWIYFGLLQNNSQATVLCGIGPAWSLCIEASFYVALPLWALLMARVQRGRSRGRWCASRSPRWARLARLARRPVAASAPTTAT